LSNSVGTLKKRLQEAEAKDDLTDILYFAEENKLAIICWASQSFWKKGANWSDLEKKEFKTIDNKAADLADAWEKAIKKLCKQYDIPVKNYLLCGYSGAAQYATRLALKKPEYFLAVHVHIPSSFDKPVEEANSVLWCLTTGEWEVGYDRSIEFLEEAQKMKFPIIYKAIPRLGHSSHPVATKLGIEFFRYALSVQDEINNQNENKICPKSFQFPSFIGDVYRQQVYEAQKLPDEPGIRVPLPTAALAEIWRKQ
jgi:predicted esterase